MPNSPVARLIVNLKAPRTRPNPPNQDGEGQELNEPTAKGTTIEMVLEAARRDHSAPARQDPIQPQQEARHVLTQSRVISVAQSTAHVFRLSLKLLQLYSISSLHHGLRSRFENI